MTISRKKTTYCHLINVNVFVVAHLLLFSGVREVKKLSLRLGVKPLPCELDFLTKSVIAHTA